MKQQDEDFTSGEEASAARSDPEIKELKVIDPGQEMIGEYYNDPLGR